MNKWIAILGTLLAVTATQAGDLWMTNFDKAAAKAKEEGKYMLLDFSGSDWCGWCIKLDKEVFSQQPFQDYAKENLITVKLDFPRSKEQPEAIKKQNKMLSEKYEIRGFPTVIILSPAGKAVGKTGYKAGGAENYVEHINAIIAVAKPKAEAKE
jgi:protein disulfide-isomerase